MPTPNLKEIVKLIRYYILTSTTAAGSGHPTSSLSATELMTALIFQHFRFDLDQPDYYNNDRLIFSKGHAAPLFYALWAAAGKVTEEELLNLRKFDSPLEGHPTMQFPFTEAATGSLGQGLSIGVGMALNAKLDKLSYRTYVLLGDSEVAEGSVWEAMELAAYYKLDNLVGILDVNRLGQRGETMHGHNVANYEEKCRAFGWETIVVDGHSLEAVNFAYETAAQTQGKPTMIIAKTIKGQGVSFIEDQDNWHGKPLNQEELKKALAELGEVDKTIIAEIIKPEQLEISFYTPAPASLDEHLKDQPLATRKAYGRGLVKIYQDYPQMVVLDAETSNSTYAEIFKKAYPDRFFEMFIAEQNMVGTALGFSRRDKIPFVSTFAAFFSRAFDQIRMSQYSNSNIKFVGSHAGVSIGEDGSSQMGLEDIAMFRTLLDSVVLYPSDAVSTEKLVREMAQHFGNVYMRTTRGATLILYDDSEEFPIGGSKVLRRSENDVATIVGAGITLHQALAAYEELQTEGINIRVIDLYSIKPIDVGTLKTAVEETGKLITVEDHFAEGGIGEAVRSALGELAGSVHSLAVKKMPRSGQMQELLDYEGISSGAIVSKVKELI